MMITPFIGLINEARIEFDPILPLPQDCQVYLTPVVVDDESTSRRQANDWLKAREPRVGLVRSTGYLFRRDYQTVWRFEVVSIAANKVYKRMGELEVDAYTGQVVSPAETFEQLIHPNEKSSAASVTTAIPYIGVVLGGYIVFDPALALMPDCLIQLVPTTMIDEWSARRKANGWLLSHVGNLVSTRGRGILLSLEDQIFWRFAAFVSGGKAMAIGPLGYVRVEGATGRVLNSMDEAEAMRAYGERIFSK